MGLTSGLKHVFFIQEPEFSWLESLVKQKLASTKTWTLDSLQTWDTVITRNPSSSMHLGVNFTNMFTSSNFVHKFYHVQLFLYLNFKVF